MSTWWIGTYDPSVQNGTGRGIYRAESNPDGTLGEPELLHELPSPSYLLADGDRVVAALEGLGQLAAIRDGAVKTRVGAGGTFPCHLSVLADRVVVANYGDGAVAVVGDGGPEQVLAGHGSGPHPAQDGPHAHASLLVDASTALTTDLGADLVHVHAVRGTVLERTASVALPAGTGPRDLALHPSGAILVLGELDGSLHALRRAGEQLAVEASASLPGFAAGSHAAAIAMRSDLIYAGVRGANRIAVLRLSQGGLVPVTDVDCGGDWPRHLVLDGDLLHVANQRSHGIASLRIGADGVPVLIGEPTGVPSPAFLLQVA